MTEHLVLADERRARDLRDHKARVKTAMRREEGREAARERVVHELLAAPLADVGELGRRDRREIKGDGQGLTVEVTARDELDRAVSVEEDGGVIGDAVDLAREHLR